MQENHLNLNLRLNMNKIVSTILLTQDNCYLCDGELPHRPQFDKQFLSALIEGEIISEEAAKLLPKSMTDKVLDITNEIEPTIPITIKEIDGLTDILIVVRSNMSCNGKKFRFDNFDRILRTGGIEIWKRHKK